MTSDLALIAERRGGLAALLGLLTLEEPGPGLAPLVADIPALAPLASGDPAIATEYERVFLRGVPLYESVFRSEDGQHGGETVTAIVERYERLGFGEHLDRRWRVAGPDHLGLQLRCLAHLCHEEAAAWRSDLPDKAMKTVEAERTFLAHHLAGWAPVAVRCAIRYLGEGAYSALLAAIADHLTEEFDRLRPAPDLGSQIDIEPLPTNLGPARLSRLLLAPATSGTWLSTTEIARASRSLGAPWRPSDTRSALRHVIEDAHDTGDLHIVLEPIADNLGAAIAWHHQDAARSPGNAANARRWALTAESMRDRLVQVAESGLHGRSPSMAAETFTVSGTHPVRLTEVIDKIVSDLRNQGFCVERHVDADQRSGACRRYSHEHENAASVRPGRRWLLEAAAVGLVSVSAALLAYGFKELIARAIQAIAGSGDATLAADSRAPWLIGLIVAIGVLVASEISWMVKCRRGERVGLEAIADAARGEGVGPDLRCTMMRSTATFTAMASMASLGREAAILEMGGSVGAYAGRKFRVSVANLAIVGVSAAFAAAYHAPIAAMFYVREHVVPGASRRATIYAAVGGLMGFAVSAGALRSKAPLPKGGPLSWSALVLALVGLVPVYLIARVFFELRRHAIHPGGFIRRHRHVTRLVAAALAGGLVAMVPLTAGNGLEVIRRSAAGATVSIAVVMVVAKMVATLATLAAGVPGGVFTPSLTIAAGTGLLVAHIGGFGQVGSGDPRWGGVLALMAVAVVVGTRAPWVAVFVVPELTGDPRLLALTIPTVLGAFGLDFVARSRGRGARRRVLDDLDS